MEILSALKQFVIERLDWIGYGLGGMLLAYSLIRVFESFRSIDKRRSSTVAENIYQFLFKVSIAFIIAMTAMLLVKICQPALKAYDLNSQMAFDTKWVKAEEDVYYLLDAELFRISPRGGERQLIFRANSPIKGYHFSPDGKFLLIQTLTELYRLDRRTNVSRLVDQVVLYENGEDMKGVLSGVRWSPDSWHFCYEISRWSKIATRDQVFVYDIDSDQKREIPAASRKLSSLFWDRSGKHLYFIKHQALDPSQRVNKFQVLIVQIPLETLESKVVDRIWYNDESLPINNLLFRKIELFTDGERYAFTQRPDHIQFVSPSGMTVGMDEKDYFYFVKSKWFRKRLFKVPRWLDEKTAMGITLKGGYMIDQVAWLPREEYVIMRHRTIGILVLDPLRGTIGKLNTDQGHTFGFSPKIILVGTKQTR